MTSTAKKGNLIEAGDLFPQVKVTADHPFNYSGGGGGDGMDQVLRRLEKVEDNVIQIKEDIANIKGQLNHFSTKSDISDAKSGIITWMITTMFAFTALMSTIVFGLIHYTYNTTVLPKPSESVYSVPSNNNHHNKIIKN